MKKINLAVIFGGISSEHEISKVSGTTIIENLNKEKYNIYPIYQSLDSKFYEYTKDLNKIKTLSLNQDISKDLKKIDNIENYLEKIDKVFPVLHGKGGEDGAIQGFLEVLNKKYVGCNIESSNIFINKLLSKELFKSLGLNVGKYNILMKIKDKFNYYYKLNEDPKEIELKNVQDLILMKYPLYVKPSNGGSSIGVTKVSYKKDLEKAILEALKYDDVILIEEEIKAKEVEVAVLETKDDILISTPGQIDISNFYTYDEKYEKKTKLIIPADITDKQNEIIINSTKKIFTILHAKTLFRCDYFVSDDCVYINEVNSMPGFTKSSMYPVLCESFGNSFSQLLDNLINL